MKYAIWLCLENNKTSSPPENVAGFSFRPIQNIQIGNISGKCDGEYEINDMGSGILKCIVVP